MARHPSLFETAALRSRPWEVAPGATGAHCLRLERRASDCAASDASALLNSLGSWEKSSERMRAPQGQSVAKGCPCTNASLTLPLPTNPLRSVDRRIGSVAVAVVVVLLSCFVFSSPLDHDAGCVGVAWLCAAPRRRPSRAREPLVAAEASIAAREGGPRCAGWRGQLRRARPSHYLGVRASCISP